MTAEAALYDRIEAAATLRATLAGYGAWMARSVVGLLARVGLAFAMITVGGVLAPVLASDGVRPAAAPVSVCLVAATPPPVSPAALLRG